MGEGKYKAMGYGIMKNDGIRRNGCTKFGGNIIVVKEEV